MATRSSPRLSYYYRLLNRTVLVFQDPATGLIPSQKYEHHAWVRDNVYAVLSIWALSLAYRKNTELDEDRARTYELEQCCVKLMRSLLSAMMEQKEKLERFKETHSPTDCLHAKYNSTSRETCAGDEEWGHLQLDATSLYLLTLAQMTAAGLQIVFSLDEVAFVQNLVFYLEGAYCIPDYGMWERGDKTNRGIRELNSSSVGIAKAALEAMSELNLFGSYGGPSSVIHVLSDEAQECDAVLTSMLPRESSSKEVDAALVTVIGFPAFAVTNQELIDLTRRTIVDKLQGQYGCKRFLRDGYKTAREDKGRLYYEGWELQGFENIECEWPLFFCYLVIDACFRGDRITMDEYSDMLERVTIKTEDGTRLVPEMYAVQADKVNKECEMPHTQPRMPIGQIPFVWAQSLYIVGRLMYDELITPGEMDPLNRRLCMLRRPDVVVQVVLLAENSTLRDTFAELCPSIQKLSEVQPIEVQPGGVLGQLYSHLGQNRKMGLSGRSGTDVGLLATSKIYSLQDHLFVFTPQNLDSEVFHLVNDVDLFVSTLRSDLAVLRSQWHILGRPTMVVILRQRHLVHNKPPPSLRQTIKKLASGYINGTRVCLGSLADFMSTSCFASLDFLCNYEDGDAENLPVSVQDYLDKTISNADLLRKGAVRSLVLSGASSVGARRKLAVAGIIKRSRTITVHDNVIGGSMSPTGLFSPNQGSMMPSPAMSRRVSLEGEPVPFVDATTELELDKVTAEELVNTLRDSESLEEQGDILHYLAMRKGLAWDTGLGKPHSVITVRDLFQEIYERACEEHQWGLVRHFASYLGKRVEDLAKTVTDLLVRQKQVTVGMPPNNEEVITRPLSTNELRTIIMRVHKGDQSTAMLAQEILAYLALFIRSNPALFREMQSLRVGLIIQVMAWEMARTSQRKATDAADALLNLSPFSMQSLLLNIISGTEPDNASRVLSTVPGSTPGGFAAKRSEAEAFLHLDVEEASSVGEQVTQGLWMRRRRLDGTLNRVPVGFYARVWGILERCPGVWVRGYCLHVNLTKEMTAGEIKFALRVEEMLNKVPEPEYRQLLVEALMVISLAVENDVVSEFQAPIDVESVVQRAHGFFLEDQLSCKGDATLCCATDANRTIAPCQQAVGICQHFYDSAPSGCYGTMTYLLRAAACSVPDLSVSMLDCMPS
ncbi:putative phosphorylase b kinase regulatory subunit alpha isoform X1 [Dermacentor variabilis]|uniref:putative phosphorylase b kinase regulatory subunit alpha isoform X1 n=1 Tax=Dermacentor variabilis TaxID=34621 RepID=UPI003F5BAE91